MANLADKLESQGNLEEAEQMHHHAIALDEACCGQLHPFCARESRRLAGFLVRSGRREEAVTLLQKALHADEQTSGSNHPYVAEDLRALGEVRVQMGQDDGLDVLLRRALEIDESWLAPDSPGVIQDLFHLAAFYTRRKQPNDAEIYLRRIIEIYDRYQPGNLAPLVISCHQLGEVHANRNEMGLALPLYCRALELEERAEGPLAEMAMLIRAALLRALRSQGQFQEAREIELRAAETWFRQAVEKDPRNVTMFVEYATFLKDQKADYDEAERWYRKALELGPNNPGVMNALGVFLTNIRGKHDEAQQLFIKTLELTPRDALVLCNLAFLLQNIRRDFENAERFYRMALENDPGQPFVNLNYATLKIVQGDLGSADKLLQKGWAAETGRRDRASARILLHKAILEQMQKHDCRLFLGQLKTLFKVGFAHVPWTGQSIVDFVGQKFPPGDSALFNAIIKAIGSLQAMPTLEALLAWKELPEAPLDASWETITEL
jgi:Flp pilus assembly protein TadD